MSNTNARLTGTGLTLGVGATLSTPNAGERTIGLDSDGALVATLPDGTSEALGGGDALDNAWAVARRDEMLALVPQLTSFEYEKVGTSPMGLAAASPAVDGALEGGGVGVASNSVWLRFTSTVFKTAKTGKWGIAFQAKFPAITAASVAYLGLVNTASTHLLAMGAVESVSATNFILQIVGGATTNVTTTLVGDTSLHNIVITGDGTTITLQVDGVTIGSTTTLTNLSDENLQIASFSSAALTPGVVVSRICYGFI